MKWLTIGASLAAVAIGSVCGQNPLDPLPDWVRQLSRAKNHLKENFERIPNYVCRETVEGYRYGRTPGRMAVTPDSLQFEVAEVEHKEMLAKPGAKGFEDKDLSAYVSAGLLGTGQFSATARNLFVAGGARITPHREGAARPPAGPSYDFEIPAFLSGYTIVTPGARVVVGQRGTFWIDAESQDLTRIEDHAVDIPRAVGMSEIGSTVLRTAQRLFCIRGGTP